MPGVSDIEAGAGAEPGPDLRGTGAAGKRDFRSPGRHQHPGGGDESGTHKKELQLWEAAGVDPAGQSWYISAGAGMGATLTMANEEMAYTLTDKGTYLAHEVASELPIILAESDDMKNTYSMIAVSTEKWPDVNEAGVNAFIEWMQGEEASALIKDYGVEEYGEPLFFLGA